MRTVIHRGPLRLQHFRAACAREVWILEGNVLKMERAAQTPGGADSATRNLVYNKGS